MNKKAQPKQDKDLSEGLARVVRFPTLIRRFDKQCRKAWKNGGSAFPPVVCWIVLDGTADHRDQIGFTGVDKLMHAIHERLRVELTPADVSARVGVDAIGIVLDAEAGERDFHATAEAMEKSITGELFEIGEQMIATTISIALRPAHEGLAPPEANLARVARAGERLVADGGNRIDVAATDEGDEAEATGRLLGQLTRALRDDNLKVVFQPLLATSGPKHERVQVLPRLVGSNGGLIPAARFIPVAAEQGVLPALDHWMIAHAVDMLRRRAEAQREIPTLFLNQSAALIDDPEFLEWVIEHTGTLEAETRSIVLEFSILDLKTRLREAMPVLKKLQKHGVLISLSGIDESVPETVMLKHLPADYLRMKANFARRMLQDEELIEEFEEFAGKARKAGRKLIVPMLEDAAAVSKFWKMDVDLIQGNFIQQPSEDTAEA